MEDGNTVLQAEKILFKVHRSVLKAHSPVFEDMFHFPPNADEIEGCPVVQMMHDRAEDVEAMLRVLYCKVESVCHSMISSWILHWIALFRMQGTL